MKKLTYCDEGYFPFLVPEKDASFASSVGPQTVYPAGFALDQALQIYWRAQNYALTANGHGALADLTQALAISGATLLRNASVSTSSFFEEDGLAVPSIATLAAGIGMQQTVAGGGIVTATGGGGGTNSAPIFNLLIALFYPEIFAPDPVVKYAGQWWPAMSVSCSVANTVTVASGGVESIEFDCTTLNDGVSATELGSFSFFGVSVPVFCQPLAPSDGTFPAETRSFSGALTVGSEWA